MPTDGLVEALRGTKDDGEVARIEAACAIADAALADVAPGLLDERPTEARSPAALDDRMRDLGADDISFETIVASGPNGSRPHHTPERPRRSSAGDLVVIDFGALVDGYHSDMTRTIAVGGPERPRRRAAPDARRGGRGPGRRRGRGGARACPPGRSTRPAGR